MVDSRRQIYSDALENLMRPTLNRRQGGKRLLLISSNTILAEGLRGIVSRDPSFGDCEVCNPSDLWDKRHFKKTDLVLIDIRIFRRVEQMLWQLEGHRTALVVPDSEAFGKVSGVLQGMAILRADLAPSLLLADMLNLAGIPVKLRVHQRGKSLNMTKGILSRREADALREAALGKSNKEIACSLGISAETVKTYLKDAQAKLGASNRVAAVLAAIRHGLIELPATT